MCEGEVLLIRNSYGPVGWTFPGGGVHTGESFALAAARELGEEVGFEVRPSELEFIGTFLLTKEYKKDTVHVFSLLVVDKPEVVVDNREVVEARWFGVADLPVLTPSGAYAWKLYSHAN
jgi:8-oxo-dGTP pyrophosphatase MutT (NUDIX family)